MMDKQIEEICPKLNCKKDCKYYGKSNCYRCNHKDVCQLRTFSYCEEKVKEHGCEYYQQEIPEGAVVLTEEEYTRLKGQEPIMIKPVEPIYLAEIRQLEYRLSEFGRMMNEMNDDLKKAKEKILQVRKETAEKIYKEYLCDILSSEAKEEFAKQFKVELK